jgi:hypothetical protein
MPERAGYGCSGGIQSVIIIVQYCWLKLYVTNTVHILAINTSTNALNKIQFMTSIRTTCFGTRLPSSENLSDERNTSPTRSPSTARHGTLHTSHASSGRNLCGSQKSRQMFVCVLHTEYIYSYQLVPGTAVT